MKIRKEILTAAVLSASVGLGAPAIFAQTGAPGTGSSMPGSQERSTPSVPRQEPTIPGQPTPGLPETEPMPGQPGTIPERVQPPRAGDTQRMAVTAEDIKKAQEALKAQGLNPGTEGVMDAQTQQALRQFQQQNDLPVTGVLDEKTAEKLGVNLGAAGAPSSSGPSGYGTGSSSSPSSSGPGSYGSGSSSSPSSGSGTGSSSSPSSGGSVR